MGWGGLINQHLNQTLLSWVLSPEIAIPEFPPQLTNLTPTP